MKIITIIKTSKSDYSIANKLEKKHVKTDKESRRSRLSRALIVHINYIF